ncbi:MAG TPA: C25 family cysteine peptidase, partial [Ignavibacteria bacterium]|nr:C25 family cysteine peptidase [Ignavibacteria bacterium]
MSVNVLSSTSESIRLEFVFNGYDQQEVKINGENYLYLSAPGLVWMMEKGKPQIPVYKNSITISDNAAMNFRILSEESDIINTGKIMPSKGHMTRDIDINMVPFTFDRIYSSDEYYPSNTVSIDDPYIIRDLRGMTFEINPLQYNAAQGKMKVYKKLVVEFYNDRSKQAVNVYNRLSPLTQVSGEFAPIYREMFLNYGMGQSRYDSIPEPGKVLFICPTAYMTAIQPLVAWKQQRGMNVTVAEYPTATGSGNTAIKTYIQNMYNSAGSVTYIILVGDVADIPTLSGTYEQAPSDPCYVKLAGTDSYPDAFISRISCQNAASVSYVCQKFIRFERDIELGAAWYNKGAGIGGPDAGGSPSYTDSARMNFIRDTLLANGFTSVDKIYPPGGTIQTILNSLNEGRYVLDYIGHGSGTSWSNTGFSTTNVYQLNNGWKEPFIVDVACLNGNFTLNECLEEAWLRAGDTANPKGAVTAFGSSTNASWVPPCDMQTEAIRLLAHKYRKTAGSIAFFGVMKGMDLWGGSSGEGLKLMEQYNLFGDCTLLLTRGVPLGPSISHTPLANTENMTGPYVVNCVVTPSNAPLKPGCTKLLWSRNNANMTDSVVMTNTSGNNWTANIPGNGSSAIYRYCIKTLDTMNRAAIIPGVNTYFQFTASTDNVNPVITHSALTNCPRVQWPSTVTASAT